MDEAIRQLFDGMESFLVAPAQADSEDPERHGLVEQQMWFSRIRTATPKSVVTQSNE